MSSSSSSISSNSSTPIEGQGRWTKEEHAIFMKGLEHRPKISWKDIAAMVGTRTPRQTRTHAQKYYQKLARYQKRQEKKRNQQLEQMNQRLGIDTSPLMYRPSFIPQAPSTPVVGPPTPHPAQIHAPPPHHPHHHQPQMHASPHHHHHHQVHTPVHAAPLNVERLPEIDVECLDALGQLFEPMPIVPRRLNMNATPSWQQALTKPDHGGLNALNLPAISQDHQAHLQRSDSNNSQPHEFIV